MELAFLQPRARRQEGNYPSEMGTSENPYGPKGMGVEIWGLVGLLLVGVKRLGLLSQTPVEVTAKVK